MSSPYGVAVDRAGNLFIADLGNDAIRKVNTSGIISSITGNGTPNYTGDGAAATAATLNLARDVAVDGAGNIYVADTGNAVIRKIDGAGIISTIAGNHIVGDTGDGGSATAGEINSVFGLMLDASDNLILADNVAQVPRKVSVAGTSLIFPSQLLNTMATAQIVTASNAGGQPLTLANVAITGSGFSIVPSGGTDCSAALVLAPAASCRIAISFKPTSLGTLSGQVVVTDNSGGITGTQQTIAITGVGSLTPATATLAVSPSTSTQGVAITFTSGVTITNPPGPGAQPSGTVAFMNGTALLGTASLVNGTATFTSCTLARGTYQVTSVYSGDSAFNPATSATVAVTINGASSTTTLTMPAGTVAQGQQVVFSTITSGTITTAPTGSMTFFDGGAQIGSVVIGANGATSFTTSFAASGIHSITASYGGDTTFNASVSYPVLLTILSGPVASVTPGIISTIAGTGVAGFGGDGGPAATAMLSGPAGGMIFDTAGNLYFSDTLNYRVRRITAAGVISTYAGTGTSGSTGDGGLATAARVSLPKQLAIDSAGNLYIADYGNSRIRMVTPSGIISTVVGTGVGGYSGDGGLATAAQILAASGVAVDNFGNIFVSDVGNQVIRKVDAKGIITTIAGVNQKAGFAGDGGASTGALFSTPGNLATNAAGDLYIADINNSRIRKISAAGVITTVEGKGVAGYIGNGGLATAAETNGAGSIVTDAAGSLYIADARNNVVRKIDGDGYISTIAGTSVAGNTGNGGSATLATLTLPSGVGVDSTGNVYFLDPTSNVLRKITTSTGILNFGTVPFNTSATATVTLSNSGAKPLSLASFASVGSTFSVLPATTRGCSASSTLAPGSSCMLTVTFSPTSLTATTGTLTLTDNSLNASAATQQIQLIGTGGKLPPTIALSSSPAAYELPGASVTFTSSVSSVHAPATMASGSISFMNGTSILGTVSLDATGSASLAVPALPAGSYAITVVYLGDTNYLGATSAPLIFGVQNDFTVALSSNSGTVSAGGSVTTQVAVTPIGGLPAVVSASCTGQPSYLVCTFAPATVATSGAPVNMQVTITATAPPVGMGIGITALGGIPLCLLFFRQRRSRIGLWSILLVASLGMFAGCGSGSFTPAPTVVPVTISVTSGQATHTIVYNLSVK